MSYLTALSLSLNNLMTKKGRTFMTSFAGSIGIIGIALILSISSGAQLYIKSVEEETLASYPISISRNSMDMTSMMTSMMKENKSDGTDDGKIHSNNIMGSMVNSMLTQLKSNDLKSFKSYLENDGKEINDYVSDIKYGYSTPLNIFRNDKDKGIIQVDVYKRQHIYRALRPGCTGAFRRRLTACLSKRRHHIRRTALQRQT